MTRKGWLLFVAMSVFWGIPYFFIKIAVKELDPTVVVFARIAIGALVLLPFAAQRKTLHVLRRKWPLLALMSLVQIVAPFLLISFGELYIASSLTSLLIATDPLLVALFAIRFDQNERVNGLRLAGLLLGLVGVGILLGFDVGGSWQQWLGAGMVLLASACYAASALIIRRPFMASLPSLGVITTEFIAVSIMLLPLAVTHLPAKVPDWHVLASLLVLGVVCTALAYLTFFALIAEVGASRGTVFTYVNPAISVLLGVTILSEPLTIAIILGFLLIIAGSWLSTGGALPRLRAPRSIKHPST